MVTWLAYLVTPVLRGSLAVLLMLVQLSYHGIALLIDLAD
jgi:hypothetical protein